MAEAAPITNNFQDDGVSGISDNSGGGKRKFDDSYAANPAEPHLPSGENHAAPSYVSVPSSIPDVDQARKKAEELAAKLISASQKRSKFDELPSDQNQSQAALADTSNGQYGNQQAPYNGGAQGGQGFFQGGGTQSFFSQQGGAGTITKRMDVPNSKVGLVIGKGGETIKYLQHQSGAKIQVTRDADADPRGSSRAVEIMGTPEQIAQAEQLISGVIDEAGPGARGIVSAGSEQVTMRVPNSKVGLIIGRGGETIKNLQSRSGAKIQVQNDREIDPGADERVVTLLGTKKQTDMAQELVKEVIDENRRQHMGGGGGGGGGGQMGGGGGYSGGGYRPPSQWGGPPSGPPMQQGGYGYQMQGSYGGGQQYGGPPGQQYGGYPQQPGYGAGWEQQRTTPPAQQTSAQQGTGYDYYSQQAGATHSGSTPASTDATYSGYSSQGQQSSTQQQSSQQQTATQPSSGQQTQQAGTQQTGYYGYQQGYGQQGYGAQGYGQQGAYSAQGYGGQAGMYDYYGGDQSQSYGQYGAQGGYGSQQQAGYGAQQQGGQQGSYAQGGGPEQSGSAGYEYSGQQSQGNQGGGAGGGGSSAPVS